MKKSFAMLILSMLLVVATLLGVSATVVEGDADNGIGSYIRFDSQETIDATVTATNGDISYDPEEGALRFDCYGNYISAAKDNNLNITWPNTFDNAAYPVVRFTYKIVATDKNGNESTPGEQSAHMWTCGTSCASGGFGIEYNKNAVAYHSVWDGTLKSTNKSRLDLPNCNSNASFDNNNIVVYVYDIGFFEDEDSAKAYTCDSDPSEESASATWAIDGIKGVEGATVSVDEEDATVWHIELPFGTPLTKIELDGYVNVTGENDGIFVAKGLSLRENTTATYDRVELGEMNITDYVANNTPLEFGLYKANAFFMGGYKIYFTVAASDKSDEEIVADIIALLEAIEYDPALFEGIDDENDIFEIIENSDDFMAVCNAYAGATIKVAMDEYKASSAATSNDDAGTDGYVKYHFWVSYGTQKKINSETVTVTLPAAPFRVLFMFNDQDMADAVTVASGTEYLKLNDGKAPIVTKDGKSFMRFEASQSDSGQGDIYFFLGEGIDKATAESGDFEYLVDLDKYSYVVINYNASATLPGKQHIYWQTDYHVINQTGYEYVKDQGFWQPTMKKNVTDEALILNNNDKAFGAAYPWTGKLTRFRMNVAKTDTFNANDYFDINYIAFFANKTDAEAFIANPSVENPLTAAQKSAVDALTFEEANGASVSGETAAKAYVLNAAKEALADEKYNSIVINTVSYTQYDVDADTKGEYKFTVTVKQGDTLGDRDVYTTAEKTVAISVPSLTVDSAIDAVKLVEFSSLNGVYSEKSAKALVEKELSEIKAAYTGFTFVINTVEFTAPTATENGVFKFNITVNGEKTTETVSLDIAKASKPIIYNYASPLMVYNTNFVYNGTGSVEIVEDANALGGAYAKYAKVGSKEAEFNLQISPNTNGNPAIEDLAAYPVVLYKYKAPGHGMYQIYYYTSTTKGHTYQSFNPVKDVSVWNYHIWPTVAGNGGADGSSTLWQGKVSTLRFDFFRNTKTDATLELDYIGLFESVEQAETFAQAPWLDNDATAEEIAAKYEPVISAINNADSAPVFAYNHLGQSIVDYAVSKGATENFYYIVKSETAAVNGTAEAMEGTPGSITFTIVFAESATNGNYVETNEITAIIAPMPYTNAETSAELRATDNGLRFKTLFTKDWMNIVKEYGSITYGTLIVPTEALGDKALTLDTVIEGVDIANVDGVYRLAEDEETLTYTAVVTNIPEAEQGTALTARAYAKFNYMGVDYVVYFDAISMSLNDVTPEETPAEVTPAE